MGKICVIVKTNTFSEHYAQWDTILLHLSSRGKKHRTFRFIAVTSLFFNHTPGLITVVSSIKLGPYQNCACSGKGLLLNSSTLVELKSGSKEDLFHVCFVLLTKARCECNRHAVHTCFIVTFQRFFLQVHNYYFFLAEEYRNIQFIPSMAVMHYL